MREFLYDESGSPTIESILWIVIFVIGMMSLVVLVKNKISGSLKNGVGSLNEAAYREYCSSKSDSMVYKGNYVNEGLGAESSSDVRFAGIEANAAPSTSRNVKSMIGKRTDGYLIQRLHRFGVADTPDGAMSELTDAQVQTGLIRPACEAE